MNAKERRIAEDIRREFERQEHRFPNNGTIIKSFDNGGCLLRGDFSINLANSSKVNIGAQFLIYDFGAVRLFFEVGPSPAEMRSRLLVECNRFNADSYGIRLCFRDEGLTADNCLSFEMDILEDTANIGYIAFVGWVLFQQALEQEPPPSIRYATLKWKGAQRFCCAIFLFVHALSRTSAVPRTLLLR